MDRGDTERMWKWRRPHCDDELMIMPPGGFGQNTRNVCKLPTGRVAVASVFIFYGFANLAFKELSVYLFTYIDAAATCCCYFYFCCCCSTCHFFFGFFALCQMTDSGSVCPASRQFIKSQVAGRRLVAIYLPQPLPSHSFRLQPISCKAAPA